jgi:ring-1,2-phenylacetyl-CoA epoxidase subunit PaaE
MKIIHKFVVKDIYINTSNAVTFELQLANEKKFIFIPGQFIVLLIKIGDKIYRRSYSISSIPSLLHESITITIKVLEKGVVSNYLFNNIKKGSLIDAEGPFGDFVLNSNLQVENYFFWAAGSGITPIYSIINYIVNSNFKYNIYLFYSVKSKEDIIFKNELEKLSEKKLINLFYFSNNFISDSSYPKINIDLLRRLTVNYSSHLNYSSVNYICGPSNYKSLIQSFLLEVNCDSNIKFESFSIKSHNPDVLRLLFDSNIIIKSFRKNLEIPCKQGESILESLIAAQYNIDYSCMTGSCGLCRMTLYEGSVIDQNSNVYNNTDILCCNVFPITNKVKLF